MIRYHRFSSIVLSLIVMIFLIVPISADSAQGAVNIHYHGTNSHNQTIPLVNVPFVIYHLASYEDGNLVINQEYQDLNMDLANLDSSLQRDEAIRVFNYLVSNKITGTVQYTNDKGKAKFGSLLDGVYLIAQTTPYQYDNGYFKSLPFLISVSGSITVEPKSEWSSEEEPKQVIAIDTSDNRNYQKYLILSCLTIMLGYITWNKFDS